MHMPPTVLRYNKIRVVIYTNDHRPEHVHIIGPGAQAKVDLNSLEVISVSGFSKKAMSKILKQLELDQDHLQEFWRSIHE